MNGTSRVRLLLIAGSCFFFAAAAAKPTPAVHVIGDNAEVEYPIRITFSIEAESEIQIRILELEFGLTGRDCTPDTNIVVPDDFSPTGHVDSTWTWNVASSSNLLPPGMRIWWNWRFVDAMENEFRTEKQWITWIDDIHDWRILTSENILLHWYRGTEEYNRDFLKAAEDARELLRNDVGAWPAEDIHIYIYGSNQELKDALVGEPDWIGGLSFDANQRTIMIGIAPAYAEWGMSTIAHELAHTAVDSIMGGCYASLPLWLNEGIAMYTEGGLDEKSRKILDDAIYYDSLFSLRSISRKYREIEGDPTQTYAQAYSVVKFMIEEYEPEEIRLLLDLLGEGYTYDSALLAALGVDMDGLEAAWRHAIGADPILTKTAAAPTEALSEATLPPGTSSLVLSTLTPIPPPVKNIPPQKGSPDGDFIQEIGFSRLLLLLCITGFCLSGGIGVFGLLFVWRRRRLRSTREDRS